LFVDSAGVTGNKQLDDVDVVDSPKKGVFIKDEVEWLHWTG